MRTNVIVIGAVACLAASTGCVGDLQPETLRTPAEINSTPSTPAGTQAVPSGEADAGDPPPAAASANEFAALQQVLAGLTAKNATGRELGLLAGALPPGELQRLGFTRRDVALLMLDVLAAQAELSVEQEFAIRWARALISRDQDELGQLLLAPFLDAVGGTEAAE